MPSPSRPHQPRSSPVVPSRLLRLADSHSANWTRRARPTAFLVSSAVRPGWLSKHESTRWGRWIDVPGIGCDWVLLLESLANSLVVRPAHHSFPSLTPRGKTRSPQNHATAVADLNTLVAVVLADAEKSMAIPYSVLSIYLRHSFLPTFGCHLFNVGQL